MTAIANLAPERRAALADLASGAHDVATIAERLAMNPKAVYQMRRRFELRIGKRLPRHQHRGRPLKPLN